MPSKVPEGEQRGWIVPIGGAENKENDPRILERFVTVSGGSQADIVVIPTASRLHETGPRYAYALYHQGRIQQTLGKTAEAKALYEKAKPLADGVEAPSHDPSADARILSAMIERRLTAM